MNREHLEGSLEGIRHLLSHLHGEVTALEATYTQVLSVLRRLEDKASRDDLTGLLRRNALFRKWEEIVEQCQKLNESYGVLLIDVDHFKKVNDNHGHATGDEVLKRVGQMLREFEGQGLRAAGRLGGEEFVLIAQGTPEELQILGEHVRERFAAETRSQGPVACTLSAGVASSSTEKDLTPVLERADGALYTAKRSGRNQVRAA